MMVDAGVPDGFTGSLVFRPFRPLHVHAGVGTNLIAIGVRAGASLYLLPTQVSPSLNAEAGHYFPGNANGLGFTEDADYPLLRQVGYDYANLHLGFDLGRDRFSFYIHAGFSVVRGTLRHVGEAIEDEGEDDEGITVVAGEATATIIAPSARLGFLVFF